MNKNIFFISILMIFSAFNAVQASAIKPKEVKHESIQGMPSIQRLRRLNRDCKEATRVADAMSAAGLPEEELSPLSPEQQNYVRGLFDQYGVRLSSSLLGRMRCAKDDSPSIGALTDRGIYVFPPQMFVSKGSMPASVQVWGFIFDAELYKNSLEGSVTSIATVSTAENRALAQMKCPSCMHEVSSFYRSLAQPDRLVEAGQRIYDSRYIDRAISDLGPKAAPCKSCKIAGTDKSWIELE